MRDSAVSRIKKNATAGAVARSAPCAACAAPAPSQLAAQLGRPRPDESLTNPSEVEQHRARRLEVADPRVGEARHAGAVDDAVVCRPRDLHHRLLDQLALVVEARRRPDLAHARDRHLGQVDHGARVRAAEVADVREREGAALEVRRLQLARLG